MDIIRSACIVALICLIGLISYRTLRIKENQSNDWLQNPKTIVIEGAEYLVFQDPHSYDKFCVTLKAKKSIENK